MVPYRLFSHKFEHPKSISHYFSLWLILSLNYSYWLSVKTLYPFCSHQNSWDLWINGCSSPHKLYLKVLIHSHINILQGYPEITSPSLSLLCVHHLELWMLQQNIADLTWTTDGTILHRNGIIKPTKLSLDWFKGKFTGNHGFYQI